MYETVEKTPIFPSRENRPVCVAQSLTMAATPAAPASDTYLALAVLNRRELHVPFHHPEELAALVEVEVRPHVWPANEHDAQLLLVHELVAHRRVEEVAIGIVPCVEIVHRLHVAEIAEKEKRGRKKLSFLDFGSWEIRRQSHPAVET